MLNNQITIGLPFYNNEKTLELAIESILKQTFFNWKLILINDGSTDKSDLIASKYANEHTRISYINDFVNKGLIYRLNQIIDLTDTEYLVRMDADDIMFPNRLEKQIEVFINNKDINVVSSGAIIINDKNEITGIRDCEKIINFNYSDLFEKSFIIHPTVTFRTSWIASYQYSDKYYRAEDLELWCRSFQDINLFRISEPLLFYREGNVNVNNYVSSMKTKLKILNIYARPYMTSCELLLNKYYSIIKIILYKIFGLLNMQFFLTKFRSKHIKKNDSIVFYEYINILKNNKKSE
jgi:glycosyltransferase involved in cell wall biosynthesis